MHVFFSHVYKVILVCMCSLESVCSCVCFHDLSMFICMSICACLCVYLCVILCSSSDGLYIEYENMSMVITMCVIVSLSVCACVCVCVCVHTQPWCASNTIV